MGKGRVSPPSPPRDDESTPNIRGWDIRVTISVVIALGWALSQVIRNAWTTDDAYISFRYAANLLDGLGLVYNAGERVEGYSNFLWTLWCALGMRLGFSPEGWAQFWGAACYAATLILLAAFSYSRRDRVIPSLPVAALLGALHSDWQRFATCGLETSAFTMLATAGFVLLVTGRGSLPAAGAGVALALGALTRPDGVLFAAVGGGYLLFERPLALRRLLAYLAVLVAIGAPHALWKLAFYGELLPNTFYAKSGQATWLDQGLVYAGLYFERYWVVLAGLPLAAWAWVSDVRRGESPEPSWTRAATLAAIFALLYSASIVKVGGDFMFARLLIPVTPFFLVLLELALERLKVRHVMVRPAIAGALAAAMVVTPAPLAGGKMLRGILDEWDFYQATDRDAARVIGKDLGRIFDGLPMRIGFAGTQAILAYYSRAPWAIETSAGLTDSFVAHSRLTRRGRIGHEKRAPLLYLIERRKVHVLIYDSPGLRDSLEALIPVVPIHLGSISGYVLRWEPDLMRSLRERGAQFSDFPQLLDRYREQMRLFDLQGQTAAVDKWLAQDYPRVRRFYFDHVADPVREEYFKARATHSATPARR